MGKKPRCVIESGNLGRTRKRRQESKQVSLRPFPWLLILLAGELDAQQQLSCLQHWQWLLQSLTLHSILTQLEEMLKCFPEAGMKEKLLGKEISTSIIIIHVLTTEKITDPGTSQQSNGVLRLSIEHMWQELSMHRLQ